MSYRKELAADPWGSASPYLRRQRVSQFQAALQFHLPKLDDAIVAESELRALLFHERIYTARRGKVTEAVANIRKHLEAIAQEDGASLVLQELFHRRHESGRDWEPLKSVVECVFLLQFWRGDGTDGDRLDRVLSLFEKEAAAEITKFRDQGRAGWAGVWAIGALVALWERQTGKTWTSKTVNWGDGNKSKSRGAYLRAGYDFLGQAFELDSTVESAFARWVVERERAKVG